MGFFSSDNALETDMDIPDLENQRRDVKPRSTSNYLIPTVLFGLFLLVLIPGLNYYIATVSSGDQSAHFVKETAKHDAMIAKLATLANALEDQSADFTKKFAEHEASILKVGGSVKALEDQSAHFATETAKQVAELLLTDGVVKALEDQSAHFTTKLTERVEKLFKSEEVVEVLKDLPVHFSTQIAERDAKIAKLEKNVEVLEGASKCNPRKIISKSAFLDYHAVKHDGKEDTHVGYIFECSGDEKKKFIYYNGAGTETELLFFCNTETGNWTFTGQIHCSEYVNPF
eukprot:201818_1